MRSTLFVVFILFLGQAIADDEAHLENRFWDNPEEMLWIGLGCYLGTTSKSDCEAAGGAMISMRNKDRARFDAMIQDNNTLFWRILTVIGATFVAVAGSLLVFLVKKSRRARAAYLGMPEEKRNFLSAEGIGSGNASHGYGVKTFLFLFLSFTVAGIFVWGVILSLILPTGFSVHRGTLLVIHLSWASGLILSALMVMFGRRKETNLHGQFLMNAYDKITESFEPGLYYAAGRNLIVLSRDNQSFAVASLSEDKRVGLSFETFSASKLKDAKAFSPGGSWTSASGSGAVGAMADSMRDSAMRDAIASKTGLYIDVDDIRSGDIFVNMDYQVAERWLKAIEKYLDNTLDAGVWERFPAT